jgi:hypothetical protein
MVQAVYICLQGGSIPPVRGSRLVGQNIAGYQRKEVFYVHRNNYELFRLNHENYLHVIAGSSKPCEYVSAVGRGYNSEEGVRVWWRLIVLPLIVQNVWLVFAQG